MSDAAPDNLPEWDLSDLYRGLDAPELSRDLARLREAALAFAQTYRGHLHELDGDALARAIAAYETMEEGFGRILSFAYLQYARDMSDPAAQRFFQDMQEQVSDITSGLIFVTLDLNRLEEADLAAKIDASPDLARFRPWLRDLRVFRPHQLSDEMEQMLHEKAVAGRAAWVRLFDETMAGLRFSIRGEERTIEQALNLLTDRDASLRRDAAKSLGEGFGRNIRLMTLITNTLVKDKEIEDKWRVYETPEASRHLANQVEPEVVAALVSAVREAYPRLAHRYYRLKARWMGQERLDYWDRGAPLPEAEDRLIPWDEARDIVLGAYRGFSPEMGKVAERFFAAGAGWIDAPARPGKAPGAFAHPTVPGAHPYLLLNYLGRTRDVMTLAHELGHGVHQVLAGVQGPLMADTPLTLAETASVFGEQLTFRALLKAEKDPSQRRILLATKIEDMLNTVVRQVAFYDFERRLHDERRQGELSSERIGEHWLAVQRESLGDAFRFDPEYQHYWCYVSHFIHAPFYVYAYAFGDCLVNALYAVYADAAEGFAAKYLAMLRAGGTLRYPELLAPFKLDAKDPAFWSKGLGVISDFIDQIEATF